MEMSTLQNQQSPLQSVKGGIPLGSKLGPIAFIIKISQLPRVVGTHTEGQNISSNDEDMVIFMGFYYAIRGNRCFQIALLETSK